MANDASTNTWSEQSSRANQPSMAVQERPLALLPPGGPAVGVAPLLKGCKSWIFRRADAGDALSFFADYMGMRHALGLSSGRAALSVILNGLQSLRPGRSVVALPAYTCFSVAASVARAGLKLYPVEIDSQTLDYDYEQLGKLPSDELLCILTSNLFGFVNDVGKLREIAREKDAFVVDDAAQSLGASRSGSLSGTTSDVSFFSLGRGKPLPTGEGGIVVTDSDEIAEAIHEQLARLAASSWTDNAVLFAKVLMTAVFINRHLYWVPDSLPFLKLGTSPFDPSFPMKRLPSLSRELAHDLLGSLAELNEGRRRKAAWITQAIGENESFTVLNPPTGCNPTYLRFPLLAKNRELRRTALRELRRAGIGASPFYPSAICDIPGIEKLTCGEESHRPKAEDLASRLLTLPTHSQVRKEDAERMGHVLTHLPKTA